MAYLVDTSILARLANTADPFPAVAARAVLELHRAGEVLHLTAQNLVEFRNLATRAKAVNGLGLSTVDAETKATVFEGTFPLLAETPNIYPAWKALVCALGVVGKRVHDARLVAVCHVHVIRPSGSPGRLPAPGPHRSGRARLTHPAPRTRSSLRDTTVAYPLAKKLARECRYPLLFR